MGATVRAIRMDVKPWKKAIGVELVGTAEIHGLFFCLKIFQTNTTNLSFSFLLISNSADLREKKPRDLPNSFEFELAVPFLLL
ncbi:hypothetical protein ACFX2I_012491 [Malus domestica]